MEVVQVAHPKTLWKVVVEVAMKKVLLKMLLISPFWTDEGQHTMLTF